MIIRWAACHCSGDGLEVLAGQIVHRERSSIEGADLRHALPADLHRIAVEVLGSGAVSDKLASLCMLFAARYAQEAARGYDCEALAHLSCETLRRLARDIPRFPHRGAKAEMVAFLLDLWHRPLRVEDFADEQLGATLDRLDNHWQIFLEFTRNEKGSPPRCGATGDGEPAPASHGHD